MTTDNRWADFPPFPPENPSSVLHTSLPQGGEGRDHIRAKPTPASYWRHPHDNTAFQN